MSTARAEGGIEVPAWRLALTSDDAINWVPRSLPFEQPQTAVPIWVTESTVDGSTVWLTGGLLTQVNADWPTTTHFNSGVALSNDGRVFAIVVDAALVAGAIGNPVSSGVGPDGQRVIYYANTYGLNIYTSDQAGLVWTHRSGDLGIVGAIEYGDGKFVAGGSNYPSAFEHRFAYSTDDGATWSQANDVVHFRYPGSSPIYGLPTVTDIHWNGTMFMAVGCSVDEDEDTTVYWDEPETGRFHMFKNAGGSGIATGQPTAKFLTSTDGITWTLGYLYPMDIRIAWPFAGVNMVNGELRCGPRCVAYSPTLNRWIVGGVGDGDFGQGTIQFSDDDGYSWSPQSGPVAPILNSRISSVEGLTWDATANLFVAVGWSVDVFGFSTRGGYTPFVATSPNGITWTLRIIPDFAGDEFTTTDTPFSDGDNPYRYGGQLLDVDVDATGRLVAVGWFGAMGTVADVRGVSNVTDQGVAFHRPERLIPALTTSGTGVLPGEG